MYLIANHISQYQFPPNYHKVVIHHLMFKYCCHPAVTSSQKSIIEVNMTFIVLDERLNALGTPGTEDNDGDKQIERNRGRSWYTAM